MNTSENKPLVLLLLLAGFLFSLNLGGYDVWPPDEPRFAQVSREMMQSGDYLVPHINGEPYKEKPPLFFWTVAALSWPLGDVTEVTVRIPSVVAGVLTLLLTCLLARRLYGDRVAFWAGVILITTWRVWWQARFGQIDMFVTLWLTLVLYTFWRWHESRKFGWLLALYLSAAAAVISKGPGIAVFPGLLVLAFYWREKRTWWTMRPIFGACIVIGLYALWMLPARMGTQTAPGGEAHAAVAANLFRQTLGRFGGTSHMQAPWYYLINLPIDWMPWSLFLPWALPWVWRNRKEGEGMRLLLSWSVPAFIFFSIALGKRQVYLLPLAPALAILFARGVLEFIDNGHIRPRQGLGIVWALMLAVAGAGLLALPFTEFKESWSPVLGVVAALWFAMALYAVVHTWRRQAARIHKIIAVQMALICMAAALVLFPIGNRYSSAKNFCELPRNLVKAGADFDIYSAGFSREEYIYYARHFHTPVFTELLPMDAQGVSFIEVAKAQSKLMRTVGKAVADIPVADFQNVQPAERAALHEAVLKAVEASNIDAALRASFEKALTLELDNFFARFAGERPALLFVQEEDWRWIIALHPAAGDLSVLAQQAVGRREVLMLGNAAGVTLAKTAKP